MRSVSFYKQTLKKKGWYFCFNEVRKRIFRLRWLRNMNVVEAAEEDKMYRYLKKYYQPHKPEIECRNLYPNKIWICWLQGMERAPHIVKRCYESVQQYADGREIVLITEKNIRQFVDFPDYIWEKYRKKRIPNAQMSDLLRISLLAQYGGIWIDATCFLTDKIPDFVTNAPVFLWKSFLSNSHCKSSNWFIAAQPYNLILCQIRNTLYEYWRCENFLKHYFIFHLCLSIVVDANCENRLMWKNMPTFPNSNPHLLQFELFDQYDKERFEQIKYFSFIHKLSYKFPQENFEKDGTFYDVVVK
jgi:mannosyltransferase OCH1-like enzyme